MSHPFAIAGVTDALRELLTASMQEAITSGIVDAAIAVTAQAPDRIPTSGPSRLNLFLYDAAPDSALSNSRLPERGPDGTLASVPMLALDLTYLMTVYASADLEAEIILGCAMLAMHENPGLSRDQIRKLLDPTKDDVTGVNQSPFRTKARTLADQFEAIRITQRYLKPDDMSKIWSSLQSHYRPSVVYGVTVVMLERARRARAAPPVLTRGAMDRGPESRTSLVPPLPSLLSAAAAKSSPAAQVGETLKLFGVALDGSNVLVRFQHVHLTSIQLTVTGTTGAQPPLVVRRPDPDGLDAAERREIPPFADCCVEVNLAKATPAGAWAAGVYEVSLTVTRPGENAARTSNTLAVAVAPSVDVAAATVTVLPASKLRVKVSCDPPVRERQTATLFVASEQFPPLTPTTATATLTFESTVSPALRVSGSQHLLRLRVDGVDSIYIERDPLDERSPPVFDPTQFLSIP